MRKLSFILLLLLFNFVLNAQNNVTDIFKADYRNQLFMDVEVALAEAQAELGIIPDWAAKEIKSKADLRNLSTKDIAKEQEAVRHSLVARLNVWKRSIDSDAA